MSVDPDAQRAEMFERWERAAAGWGKRAAQVRDYGMPVSSWMIEHLDLQPGHRVLELAAGPGDTGFLAAELIQPGGTLICSDGADAMLEVARGRAREFGVQNVEFKRLELEWIDMPTAELDAVLCRWGVMLSLDPAAALHEIRRVLRPGGRAAIAVWDEAARNPWATIPMRSMIERGLVEPPDPSGPGMFALAAPGVLEEMVEAAGFVEVRVEAIAVERVYATVEEYLDETLDLSMAFSEAFAQGGEDDRAAVRGAITDALEPFRDPGGVYRLPGSSLVAAASA